MSQQNKIISNKIFFITILIYIASVGAVGVVSNRKVAKIVKMNLESLPMNIIGYHATKDNFPKSVYEELDADKHIYRHYGLDGGKKIDLYIGYYGTAKGGRTGHNPNACLPGAGWGIISDEKERIVSKYYSDGVDVSHMIVRKGTTLMVIYHWYQSSGKKILSSGIKQNIQRFKNKILYNRNDGAFVRISILTDQDRIKNDNILAKDFAIAIMNLLPEFWPVEK